MAENLTGTWPNSSRYFLANSNKAVGTVGLLRFLFLLPLHFQHWFLVAHTLYVRLYLPLPCSCKSGRSQPVKKACSFHCRRWSLRWQWYVYMIIVKLPIPGVSGCCCCACHWLDGWSVIHWHCISLGHVTVRTLWIGRPVCLGPLSVQPGTVHIVSCMHCWFCRTLTKARFPGVLLFGLQCVPTLCVRSQDHCHSYFH